MTKKMTDIDIPIETNGEVLRKEPWWKDLWIPAMTILLVILFAIMLLL